MDLVKIKNSMTFELSMSFLFIFLGMMLGIIVNTDPVDPLREDFREIRNSDVIGVLGTIYALITAFILFNVWNHYNETSTIYGQEAEAVIHLWNFIDFINDDDITRGMKFALLEYLEVTLTEEFPKLERREEVVLPSREFSRILRILDSINFDDARDATAFNAIIGAFKDLSHSRNQRIEFSLTNIPTIIKGFYIIASAILWVGFLLQTFDELDVYFFNLLMITLIVVFSYTVIYDLDKPLNGLLVISLESYHVAKLYITETEHLS